MARGALAVVLVWWAGVASAQQAPAPDGGGAPVREGAAPGEAGGAEDEAASGGADEAASGAEDEAASGAAGEAASGAEDEARREAAGEVRRVVVIDAATRGIDPVVGQHVTHRMRATAESMGYRVLPREASVAAARRVGMGFPPSPAELWRATWVAGAQRGLAARAWAHEGRYVVEIMAASLDGAGPFFARGTSGADDLHEVVAGLTRQALPPPAAWDEAGARRWAGDGPRAGEASPADPAPSPVRPEGDGTDGDEAFYDQREDPEPLPQAEGSAEPKHRFEIALQTEGAIGTSGDTFYNHLLGLRLGYRFTEDTILSAYVAYANLRGRNGRASNLLPYAQFEHRVRIGDDTRLRIPLRLALGYLPYNGPVVRVSAGLNVPLSDRVELGLDLLSPTVWILPETTAVSLNLAAELIIRL
ncbi:MAG: hypothetical protein ACOC97_05780 [Myxococcota bacterium]